MFIQAQRKFEILNAVMLYLDPDKCSMTDAETFVKPDIAETPLGPR